MGQRGEEAARRLEAAVERLLAEASGWGETELYRPSGQGEWTAMETLAHLAEIQSYWPRQIRRVVAEPGVPFGRGVDDPERLAWVEQHRHEQLEVALTRVREAIREAAATLRALSEADWTKTGVHFRRGSMDLGAIVEHVLVGHVEEHVEQALRAVAAARTASGPGGG